MLNQIPSAQIIVVISLILIFVLVIVLDEISYKRKLQILDPSEYKVIQNRVLRTLLIDNTLTPVQYTRLIVFLAKELDPDLFKTHLIGQNLALDLRAIREGNINADVYLIPPGENTTAGEFYHVKFPNALLLIKNKTEE